MFENEELTVSSLPSIDNIDFKSIDKGYLKVILISNISFYIGFLCLILLAKKYLEIFLLEEFFTTVILLYIGYVIAHFAISILGFNKRKYAIRMHDISYRKGIVVSSLSTIPFSRIQHLDITQGILSRRFKLASLKLYTAGDKGSDMVIKGLAIEEAERIRGYITEQINERI